MGSEKNESPEKHELAPGKLEDFVSAVNDLSDAVEALPRGAFDKISILDRRGKYNRRWLWVLGVVVVALVAIGALATINTLRLDHSLNVQRTRACAFYTIFLQADTPQARAASPDKAAYDHAFKVIRANYVALDCIPNK